MKKFFLFALLFAATAMFAEVRVETFDVKDGTVTNTYVSTPTTKECQKASWTVFAGGVLKNLGNMGSTNYAAVTRAMKDVDNGVYPYLESSTIEDGIDSLWFTWNSNGNESGSWNIVIYINGDSIDAITSTAGNKIASAPFNTYSKGGLNIDGDFTIKFVNKSLHNSSDQTKNLKRFVIDDLGWTTHGSAPIKPKPTFEFAEEKLIKKIDVIAFTNTLTNTSDATPTFESSVPEVATVAENGTVTIVGLGTTIITASVEETDNYKEAEASYTLRVVPLNFNLETFDGATNSTSGTYLAEPTQGTPSTATGIKWTTLLGSVRTGFGSWPAANIAAGVRAKKPAEENYGYLLSDVISGGIDSLAFDWNSNGDESNNHFNWNILILINGDSVGIIDAAPNAKQSAGNEFRYTLGNLKIDGDFTIEFLNRNDHDTLITTANQMRWVMDNLEWYSYEAPCEGQYGILVDGTEYIAGVKNEEQKEWLEYTITADLNKDQTFVFEDHCTGGTFMAGQDNGEGNYKFNYTEGENPAFLVPQDGHFTIYLKMYGPDNNWIWTVYADPTTGIENAAMKADVRKAIENGQIVIYRNGVRYSLQGQAF